MMTTAVIVLAMSGLSYFVSLSSRLVAVTVRP